MCAHSGGGGDHLQLSLVRRVAEGVWVPPIIPILLPRATDKHLSWYRGGSSQVTWDIHRAPGGWALKKL